MKSVKFVLLFLFFLFGFFSVSYWFSLSALNDFYVHKQNDWISTSSLPMYLWDSNSAWSYCASVSPFGAWSSWSSMGCWKSRVWLGYNSYQKWMVMRMNCSSTDTNCMLYWISNVWYTKNDNNYKFEWYNNQARALQSITTDSKSAYYYDGTLYDNVLFWHNSVIFWNTWTNETLQFMPWATYHNWILIANPFITDTSEHNIFFIKFNTNQAWSTRIDQSRAWHILQWDEVLSDNDIYELFGPSNSNLKFLTIQRNWSHFWPNETQSLYNQSDSILSSHSNDITLWFVYLTTNIEVYPWQDLPWGDPIISTWNYVNNSLSDWNNYQSCERDYSFRNFIVNAWVDCRHDYQDWIQDLEWFNSVVSFIEGWNIWNDNITWELQEYFTWITLSYNCQALVNNAVWLVKLYNIIDRDPEYYFNVISELKYITHSNPYNIVDKCWSRPSVPNEYLPINNNSNICSFDSWSNIINCFGYWSSSYSWDQTYFWMLVDNTVSMIWGYYNQTIVEPIRSNFLSWFNQMYDPNGLSCSSDYVSPIPSWLWDLINLIFVGLFVFLILKLL